MKSDTNEVRMNDFEQILRDFRPFLFKMSHAYANTAADAQDLYQEMCLQIWQSRKSFRGQSKLSTWAYRIALNTALVFQRNEKRRKKKERHYELEAESSATTTSVSEKRSIDEKKDKGLRLLLASIRDLKPLDRSIMVLYLEELTYAEIAETIGVTTTHVGVKINRIKKQLQKILKEKGYEGS